jgi:hypothetical protein
MPDQVRIFVSHHHSPEEDSFTVRLVSDLEAAGADVWVDVVGVGAADFQERTNQALDSCEWLVLVLTPAALASPWVRTEVDAAIRLMMQGRMRGIIQLLAQPVAQERIPPTWGTYAHFDAIRDYAAALNLTLHELGLRSVSTTIPSDRFPLSLTQLGYEGRVIGGVEVILPPLCNIPVGPFLMGSDPKKDKDADTDRELPQHSVTLAAFQLGTYPVTVAEYACFVRARYWQPKTWQKQLRMLDRPVVNVTWREAVAYAKWLSECTGQPWRLPNEAEWEKAARGTDGRISPLGDDFDASRCNTKESDQGMTTPVGGYPTGASSYGAQDMA